MNVRRLGATDASRLAAVGCVFLDVRAPEEYAKGHPKGARNVPYQLFGSVGFKDNPNFLAVVEALFPKDKPILVIGKIGKRSLLAAEALVAAGYETIYELRPGTHGLVNDRGRFSEDGWTTLGLPWEKQTDGGSYKELLAQAQVDEPTKASAPQRQAANKKPNAGGAKGVHRIGAGEAYKLKPVGYVYLDIRAPEEYAKGHAKGAVNVPFQLFGRGGGFKDNPEFLDVVQKLYPLTTKLLVIGKIGKRSLAAAKQLVQLGYEGLCELRPGMKGIVDDRGRYAESGWETMGLATETVTEGGSYKELKERL